MPYSIRKISSAQLNKELSKSDSKQIADIIRTILVKEYHLIDNQEGSVMADRCFTHFGKHYNKTFSKNGEERIRGYFVALDHDGNVVGGGGYDEKKGEKIKTFEVQRLFVSESDRGKGLGSKLLDLILEEAFQKYDQGYLDTRSDMKQAQDLYLSRGFKYEQSTEKKTLHSTADVIMNLDKNDWLNKKQQRGNHETKQSNIFTAIQ